MRKVALVLVVFVVGCRRTPVTRSDADADAGALPAVRAVPSTAPVASVTLAPSASTRSVVPDAAALSAYGSALDEGRRATKRKDFRRALGAYDRALAAVPDDPLVLSERGYARYLAGEPDAAEEDLQQSLARNGTATLRGATYFNLGLVMEKQGRAEEAQRAFARSNALHPTSAASAKAHGKSACVADIDRARDDASVVGTWREAQAALTGASSSTDEAAKTTLCRDAIPAPTCDGPLVVGDGLVVPLAGGRLFVAPSAHAPSVAGGFKCPPDVALSVTESAGAIIHVNTREVLCTTTWKGTSIDSSYTTDGVRRTDTFWRTSDGRRLVSVRRDLPEEASSVTDAPRIVGAAVVLDDCGLRIESGTP